MGPFQSFDRQRFRSAEVERGVGRLSRSSFSAQSNVAAMNNSFQT
jgi:hypothetical protein